jgi:hypothetical protein
VTKTASIVEAAAVVAKKFVKDNKIMELATNDILENVKKCAKVFVIEILKDKGVNSAYKIAEMMSIWGKIMETVSP